MNEYSANNQMTLTINSKTSQSYDSYCCLQKYAVSKRANVFLDPENVF